MKTHGQRWSAGLTTTILAGLLAACGSSGGTTAPTAVSGGAAAPTAAGSATGGTGGATAGACPAAAQGQEITMWSPLTGPDGKFMSDLANQFNQANGQGIKVNHLPQPDYIQKLNAAAAAKKLPEATVIRADDIAEMAVRNIIKPLTGDALTAAGGDALASDFPEQVAAVGMRNDQRYAVPLDVHPLVLFYNKDMAQQAGVTIPTDRPMTKDEFEKAADAMNKDGVAGISLGNAFQGSTLFWTMLRQFGGTVVNADGTQAAYNSEQGVQALTYLNELKQKYSPATNGAGDPEVKIFQQGKAGMVIHGPWHISDMEKLPFVGFAQVPQFGNEFAVWGGSHQVALTTDDPAKAAAAGCWIGWLSQNSVQWARAGQVPIRNSVRTGGELQGVSASVNAFAPEVESVIMPQGVPGMVGAVWGEGFGKAVDAVLLGQQKDVKKALDDAAAKTNQILEQNKQRYGQ